MLVRLVRFNQHVDLTKIASLTGEILRERKVGGLGAFIVLYTIYKYISLQDIIYINTHTPPPLHDVLHNRPINFDRIRYECPSMLAQDAPKFSTHD